ncbi:MAG: hypothetical protein ACLFTK_02745 [Anaerolineales bacterium]
MDKAITTALLIVISMVMVLLLFNAAYPAIIEGGDAINSMSDRTSNRLRTHITVIHISSEQDPTGNWYDHNANTTVDVFAWVKNTGTTRIPAMDQLDLFFGPQTDFQRIPHESAAGSGPYWSWHLENDTAWNPTATLRITIHHPGTLPAGRYFLRVVTPDGSISETFLGI